MNNPKKDRLHEFLISCEDSVLLSDIKKHTGLSYGTIRKYINEMGWKLEKRPYKVSRTLTTAVKEL